RIAIDTLQTLRNVLHAVEVGADPDMIHTRYVTDMIEVVRNLCQSDDRFWVFLLPNLQRRLGALGLSDIQAAERRTADASLLRGILRAPAVKSVRDITGIKVHHHDAAVGGHGAQDRIRYIPRVVIERPGGGV